VPAANSAAPPLGVGSMFPMTYSINRVSINPDIKPASPAEFSQPIVKKTYSEERLSPVVNTNNPANQYLQEAQPSEELNGFVKTKSIFYTDKRPNMQDPQPFSGQNVEYRIDPNAPVYSSQPKDYSLLRGSAEDMPKADVAVKYPHLPSAVGQNAEEELDLEVVPNQRRVINTNSIPQLLQPQTIEVTSPRKINRSPASVTEVVEVVPVWRRRVCLCPVWLWIALTALALVCIVAVVVSRTRRTIYVGGCPTDLHPFKGQCIKCPTVSVWNGTHCVLDKAVLMVPTLVRHNTELSTVSHKRR
jgi:hypothetical protein